MHNCAVFCACLACVGHARRVQISVERLQRGVARPDTISCSQSPPGTKARWRSSGRGTVDLAVAFNPSGSGVFPSRSPRCKLALPRCHTPGDDNKSPPDQFVSRVSMIDGVTLIDGSAMLSPRYWEELASRHGLHVEGLPSVSIGPEQFAVSERNVERLREQMRLEGYGQLSHEQWATASLNGEKTVTSEDLSKLAALVRELVSQGLPPQFMLCYDEAWRVVSSVSATLAPIFNLQQIHDFFIFYVPPGKSGWAVHRDRTFHEARLAFTEDDLPLYTTIWVALTDALPPQSGMYIVPAYADPGYRDPDMPDDDGEQYSDILLQNHQDIRAIPAKRGTTLFWSHRALHWGSTSSPYAQEPRITLTWAMAHPQFEQSLLRVKANDTAMPCFEARLALIACTLLGYHHAQPVSDKILLSLLRIMSSYATHLSDGALANSESLNFQENLVTIGHEASMRDDEDGEAILAELSKIAEYITLDRNLPGEAFGFDDLVL